MKTKQQTSKQEVKYCLEFPKVPKIHRTKSGKLFTLVVSTKRIEPKKHV